MAAGDKQGSVWVPSSCWAPQQPARGSSAMGTTERAPRRDAAAVTQHLLRAGTPRIPVNAVLFGAVT